MSRPTFDFPIPVGYDWLLNVGLITFHPSSPLQPWYYVDENESFDATSTWPEGKYKDRLIVFARRQDTDDMACFAVKEGTVLAIVEIHAWTEHGYDVTVSHTIFWDWFRSIIDDIEEVAEASAIVDCENGE